ncbi:MAG: hypothetical protein KGZ25_05740 [Planctomycetes bacterium]|nr:hypothetical protein [Planctomycetota bacterium]
MSNRTEGRLAAGSACADITPEPGIQLAGDCGRHRPVEGVKEPLYARALVLESGETRLCLLSLDLLGATNACADEVRERVADALGIDSEAVMFHVTQNHAAPSLGHCFVVGEKTRLPENIPWLRGGDERYNEPTIAKTVEAAREAAEQLEPVIVQAGRGIDGRVAFNRRCIMRDGTARRHPRTCDPEILYVEGPTDPEVGVMRLKSETGDTIALLLHHTCHPTHGFGGNIVTSDWPGVWAEMMQKEEGEETVALVLNGCCGNIHHTNHLDPHPAHDHERMAGLLSETTRKVLEDLRYQEGKELAVARTILELPLREVPPAEIEDAERILRENPEPVWKNENAVDRKWVDAATRMDLSDHRAACPIAQYEVQVFRLADTAIVAVMGEPFVELQLGIKLASPASQTYVAHFCNGYAGYIPTPEALARSVHESGYGTGQEGYTNIASKFEADAFDHVHSAVKELLGELW